ncbi:MAG TPA: zinc-ribbon domain-containing protein, partial [Myxococcota bacterium]|nr:zinc-ribbon domain-containing protein [Myxococcota bacterium]
MEITCPRCGSRYHIDPPSSSRSRSSRGLKFRCSSCGHTFGVDPVSPPAPAATKAASRALEPPARGGDQLPLIPSGEMIRLIQQQAQIYEVPDLGTLYRWILEHRVSRQDLFSVHGMRWQAIGDRPDLERFFAAADALKGKKEPALPRWDNMDVVPMEETPSTFEHQQFNPRAPLPDPSSPGLLLTDRVNQPNIPLQQPVFQERARSPIEDASVDMEMDSASEAGVAPAASMGLSFQEQVAPKRPGLVDVLPPLPNDPVPQEEEMPSSFPMDAPGVGEESSVPAMNFGDSGDEDPGSAVAIDSASSAGLDMSDETLESTFLNSGAASESAAVQLQPVGKARPPVIQMRQRRRRDDLSDEETQEAPSNIDALKVPPPPEPVLGPTPRVTISPEPPPARADSSSDGEGDRATPGWVWAIAGLGAVVITIAAVLAWSQLNPQAPNPSNLKVDPTPTGAATS